MSKAKKKGRKIIEETTQGVLLPGKFQCQCHATIHKLINNCSNCGRIVCEQEGEGECQTCGEAVIKKQQEGGIGAQKGQKKTLEEEFPEFKADYDIEKEKAIANKNTLIQRDKSNFIKNNVYDEQTDWYQVQDNVWNSKETREQAVKQLIDRQVKLEDIQRSTAAVYDINTGEWVDNTQQFDEKKFKDAAQEFINTENTKHMTERQQVQADSGTQHMREAEKKVYEDIRSELKKQFDNTQNDFSKKVKQHEEDQQKNAGKIVQNDDFYSQFF